MNKKPLHNVSHGKVSLIQLHLYTASHKKACYSEGSNSLSLVFINSYCVTKIILISLSIALPHTQIHREVFPLFFLVLSLAPHIFSLELLVVDDPMCPQLLQESDSFPIKLSAVAIPMFICPQGHWRDFFFSIKPFHLLLYVFWVQLLWFSVISQITSTNLTVKQISNCLFLVTWINTIQTCTEFRAYKTKQNKNT